MLGAYSNLFLCHCCPSGSLSRWTHVGSMLSLMCTGFICRDVFYTAVLSSLPENVAAQASVDNLQAGAVGAGESDYMAEHAARVQKVRCWLGRSATRVHIGLLLLLVRILDGIMYFLMGGNTKDGARHRRPSTPRTEEPLPCRELILAVGSSLSQLWFFLERLGNAESDSSALLSAMGVDEEQLGSETTLRLARRICLGFSAGLFRRFVLRLSSFPYRLWVIADGTCDEQVCQEVVGEFFGASTCCLGFFGQRLRQMFPTPADLLSTLGRTTVATWMRTLVWSIYTSEKEHASCRRLLLGSGPARNWALCCRERVLEHARTVHMERTASDPSQVPLPLPSRATPAQHLAAAVVANATPRNPLLPEGAGVPRELPFELQAVHAASDVSALVERSVADGLEGVVAAEPAASGSGVAAEAFASDIRDQPLTPRFVAGTEEQCMGLGVFHSITSRKDLKG